MKPRNVPSQKFQKVVITPIYPQYIPYYNIVVSIFHYPYITLNPKSQIVASIFFSIIPM